MSDCLFCKFARKEIPTRVVFEDDSCLAFEDINPKAPVHVLIIPKKHIGSINDMAPEDEATLGHLAFVARRIAQEKKIDQSGYRAVINTGTRRWPVCLPHSPASSRRPPNGLATGIASPPHTEIDRKWLHSIFSRRFSA